MIIVNERCPADHPCPIVKFCPVKAITQNGFDKPEVDNEKCIDCGLCLKNCPYRAFEERDI